MSDRTAFITKIRKALGHDAATSPAPTKPAPYNEAAIRQVAATEADLVSRWESMATNVGMVVEHVGDDPWSIAEAVKKILASRNANRVMLNVLQVESGKRLASLIAAPGRTLLQWGDPNCRAEIYTCDASVTDCRFGLADTGGLLVWSEENFGRSSTLTVPVHIVLLPVSRIVPDMVDGFAAVRKLFPDTLPSNIVVINGPSKTADIEMNLVTGVHGPKFLHVLLVG